jgi:hypothetical protein
VKDETAEGIIEAIIYMVVILVIFGGIALYNRKAAESANKCAEQHGTWTQITEGSFGCVGAQK